MLFFLISFSPFGYNSTGMSSRKVEFVSFKERFTMEVFLLEMFFFINGRRLAFFNDSSANDDTSAVFPATQDVVRVMLKQDTRCLESPTSS